MPRPVGLALGAAGAVPLVVALVFFAAPAVAVAVWPWMVTPLTVRVLAGFVATNAMTLLVFCWEPRWSGLAAGVQTVAIGIVLIVLAVARAAADFPTAPALWGFLAALGVALALTAAPLLAVRHPAVQAAPTAR